MKNIEQKVLAAVIGSGIGAALSQFLIWLLGVLVWHAPGGAEGATAAMAAVPGPVTGLVTAVFVVVGTFILAYRAEHTARPDLAKSEPAPVEQGEVAVEVATPKHATDMQVNKFK